MNKTIVFISFVVLMVLVDIGISTKAQVESLRDQDAQLQADNLEAKQEIKDKGALAKHAPIRLSTEYALVLDQVRDLEGDSETKMNVHLEDSKDTDDISDHYVDTRYKGVMGLKIKIVVDKFSSQTDTGAVLDDIHVLEKNTDFTVSEISKDNNNLIVEGEIYGI